MPRRSIPVEEYEAKKTREEENDEVVCEKASECEVEAFFKIVKSSEEQRQLTGVVLEPDTFDAHKTRISKEVIRKAAEKFLNGWNKTTKIGVQHNSFPKNSFELNQSYIAPIDFPLGEQIIKEGSWVAVIRVKDNDLWEASKSGIKTGFSIGGNAKVKILERENDG